MMVTTKRIISILMTFTLLFGMFSALAINVSAASSSKVSVVSSYDSSKRSNTFYINGKFWSARKITIKSDVVVKTGTAKATINSDLWELARFNITVKDKNGNVVATYNNKTMGFSFSLPKWSTQQYTICITSSFASVRSVTALERSNAAVYGRYYLNY